MKKPRIILAGGSGFLGQALAEHLSDYETIVLSRSSGVRWDGRTLGPWVAELEGARAIVNLTGRSVNCRHTPENRREIVESRVDSVRVIGEALRACKKPPPVWVQASGIGFYKDLYEPCDETSTAGDDFQAETCVQWEAALDEINCAATRRVIFRIGLVLGRSGGFLDPLTMLTRCFLGGQVGSGKQFISWIHIQDLNRMFRRAIEFEEVSGVYNSTGPEPVTNAEFMRELRRALHRPWSPPVPEFAARIGAWVMRTEASLAFTGHRCVPRQFLEQGFEFEFPRLPDAFAQIFGGKQP